VVGQQLQGDDRQQRLDNLGHVGDHPHLAKRQPDRAEAIYRQVMDLAPEDPTIALERPDVKVDAIMARANSAYDKGDWDEAKMVAGKVLAKQPTNIRMMRIMVSASCIDGDSVMAQQWFEKMPKGDREQMKTRCDRYGVSFKEPAQ